MSKYPGAKDTIGTPIEILAGRLYFLVVKSVPQPVENVVHFGVDNEMVYYRFYNDFGPLNLGQTYKFCVMLKQKLDSACEKQIHFYCSADPQKRANAACLIGAYLVIILGFDADEAYRPLSSSYPPFIPFRDASTGPSSFNLTIYDCLRAFTKARRLSWYNPEKFDAFAYEYFEKVENGDLNWIIPGKFLAFSGPQAPSTTRTGYHTHPPEFYLPIFKKLGITAVIRLNRKCYEKNKFLDNDIRHYDLYFPDGSCPSEAIMKRFLEITENHKGAIAVHCKAGLGRTGTLIACYMMKNHRLTAPEAIAWLRICRPGSVIGPQQNFLQSVQMRLWKRGEKEGKFLVAGEAKSQQSADSPQTVQPPPTKPPGRPMEAFQPPTSHNTTTQTGFKLPGVKPISDNVSTSSGTPHSSESNHPNSNRNRYGERTTKPNSVSTQSPSAMSGQATVMRRIQTALPSSATSTSKTILPLPDRHVFDQIPLLSFNLFLRRYIHRFSFDPLEI
eukprot:TRINITY_DN8540_c0_g1_i1.p1 TRINITY_DN8540_c0_g1~~TRINITY_DN8540_c0_g1_i1.p1  ORF type:complete len:501 (-),score=75.05 TRINITY_DN8540_c0_g1_i1:267-1769(-)